MVRMAGKIGKVSEYTLNDNLNFKFEYTVISCNFWLGPLITALKSPWRSPPGLARHPEPLSMLSMLSMLSTTQPTEPLMGEKWSCASWYAKYATSVTPHLRWFHVFQCLDNLVGLGSILKSTNSSCDQAVSTKQVWSWEEWLKKLLDRKMQPTRPFASNLSQWLSDSVSSRVDPEEATARSSVPRISTQSRLFWPTLPNMSIAREWESLWSCQHHISKFSPFWFLCLFRLAVCPSWLAPITVTSLVSVPLCLRVRFSAKLCNPIQTSTTLQLTQKWLTTDPCNHYDPASWQYLITL